MANLDWGLELLLVCLLAVTLVHAVRLERALRLLRSDRAALGEAITGFDNSARQAEAGIGRLHSVSADTAQTLAQRLEQGATLKDDLGFLIERGETLADRLDGLVRVVRPLAQQAPTPVVAAPIVVAPVIPAPVPPSSAPPGPKMRSQAERDLLLALQAAQ